MIYLNTSDNIKKTMKLVKKPNKVLAVLSSSDYLFDLVLKGIKDITCFDKNNEQIEMLKIKLEALKKLNYQEYINFFMTVETKDYLSSNILEKLELDDYWENIKNQRIKEEEKIKDQKFLNEIYAIMQSSEVASKYLRYYIYSYLGPYLKPNIFKTAQNFITPYQNPKYITYLSNKRNYEKVRNNIENINITYLNGDIKDLSYKLRKEEFDYIILSNIMMYQSQNEIIETLNNLNGTVISYIQGMGLKQFKEKLKDDNYYFNEFTSDNYHGIERNSLNNILDTYLILLDNFNIDLIDLKTVGGSRSSKVKKDTIMILKKQTNFEKEKIS